jgi:hypothetical protein
MRWTVVIDRRRPFVDFPNTGFDSANHPSVVDIPNFSSIFYTRFNIATFGASTGIPPTVSKKRGKKRIFVVEKKEDLNKKRGEKKTQFACEIFKKGLHED